MARTVVGLFAAATGFLCSPAPGQDGPPVSVSQDQSPTVKGIDGGAVRDAPFIGPPDPREEHRNEIVVTAPCSASAEQSLISGSYILDEERSDHVTQALNSAVDAMSPSIARPSFARRLRKAGAAAYAITISIAEGRFSIKNDAKREILVWISGEPIEWTQEDGQVFDVSAQANGEAISLTFRAADSERTTVYCGDGQQLVTETTIISPLLSTPIRYKVVYNRASGPNGLRLGVADVRNGVVSSRSRIYPRTTSFSIAPKIEWLRASRISMRTVSPHLRNGVFGSPPAIVSIIRCSAMHE